MAIGVQLCSRNDSFSSSPAKYHQSPGLAGLRRSVEHHQHPWTSRGSVETCRWSSLKSFSPSCEEEQTNKPSLEQWHPRGQGTEPVPLHPQSSVPPAAPQREEHENHPKVKYPSMAQTTNPSWHSSWAAEIWTHGGKEQSLDKPGLFWLLWIPVPGTRDTIPARLCSPFPRLIKLRLETISSLNRFVKQCNMKIKE